MVPYQDVIVDGTAVETGYRSCADRYQVVRQVVESLRRPFTVLDLGAASGYFAIRLTEDYAARCVAVDRSSEVQAAKGRVAAVVHAALNAEAIRRQGTFDVILGLSFLHHQKDWRKVLAVLLRMARSALIIETPNPKEQLRHAAARRELAAIEQALETAGMQRVGASPAVWDHSLERGIWLLRRDGLPIEGRIFSGSGSNQSHMVRCADELTDVLGYRPYPGSLNVRTPYAFRLGAYAMEYVDQRRGKRGRKGGDYQIWHARIEGYDGPVHIMRPGLRGHGREVLEVWAPVKLRELLGLEDGGRVRLRIGA